MTDNASEFASVTVADAEAISNAIRASREALFAAFNTEGLSEAALDIIESLIEETNDRRSALLDAVQNMTPSTEAERAALIRVVVDYAPGARPHLLGRLIAA